MTTGRLLWEARRHVSSRAPTVVGEATAAVASSAMRCADALGRAENSSRRARAAGGSHARPRAGSAPPLARERVRRCGGVRVKKPVVARPARGFTRMMKLAGLIVSVCLGSQAGSRPKVDEFELTAAARPRRASPPAARNCRPMQARVRAERLVGVGREFIGPWVSALKRSGSESLGIVHPNLRVAMQHAGEHDDCRIRLDCYTCRRGRYLCTGRPREGRGGRPEPQRLLEDLRDVGAAGGCGA